MAGPVLIVAEHWKGEVDGITIQMLLKGREMADAMGAPLALLVAGHDVGGVVDALADKGADALWVLDDAAVAAGGAEAQAYGVAQAVKAIDPRLILVGYSLIGMELMPALAAKLDCVAITNGVNVEWLDGKPAVTRPLFDGTLHTKVILEGDGPHLVAIQRGATPTAPLPTKAAEIKPVTVDLSGMAVRDTVIELVEAPTGGVDITKADVLVSVGRGLGDPAKLSLIEGLAAALGGVMSCSRPLVDQGWLPKERQVGASGKTVTPKVYLACGISGASQHLAGMSEARLIIAINKDANAPIFQVAHLGVVGDLFEIIPALTEEAAKYQ
jgi:electron transfer flavoprotein alpha subunit